MLGKEYTQKQAAAFAALAFQAVELTQTSGNGSIFFVGHISGDRLTVQDQQGNIYQLTYTGNPKEYDICQKTGPNTAICVGSNVRYYAVDSSLNTGYVLAYDSLWYYIRKIGSSTKYYLPISEDFKVLAGDIHNSGGPGDTFSNHSDFQAMLSPDGNAFLIGTVVQNVHVLSNGATATTSQAVSDYHQFAHYEMATDILLTSYTNNTFSSNPTYISTLKYPVIPGNSNIVICKNFSSIAFDLNGLANGTIPAPLPGEFAAKGLWFPNATSNSLFAQHNGLTNFTWHGDSGYVPAGQDFGSGCIYDYTGQKITNGSQTITWESSPSYAVFNSFQYVLTNSYNPETKTTIYVADIISTFVNGYLFTTTNNSWTESFHYQLDATVGGGPGCNGTYGSIYRYDETLNYDYIFEYDVDFIYKLSYFATPDVWLTNATVNITVANPVWLKTAFQNDYATAPFGPYNHEGTDIWDAYCTQTKVISDSKTPPGNCRVSFSGEGVFPSQFAYSSTNTVGAPFGGSPPYADEGYGLGGKASFSFYSGLVKKGIFDVQGGYSWPGFYIGYFPPNPAEFSWCDLNYDQLFFGTEATYDAIYGGRSTMVVNDLWNQENTGNNNAAPNPKLFGVIAQLLGDGTDFNRLNTAFKGRTYDPDNNNLNSAFIYNTNFDGIYRYSSAWLQQGNLGTGAGGGSTGQELGKAENFSNAISDLVDYASLMDAYGESTVVNNLDNLISAFKAGISNPALLPSEAAINNVMQAMIAVDPDLTDPVVKLQNELNATRAAALGGDLFQIQPDMVGTDPPDVYTDKFFAFSASFPFQPFFTDSKGNTTVFDRFLKAPDSWMAQEYYIDTVHNQEVIQGFNISDGTTGPAGLTTLGKKSVGSHSIVGEILVDYILPVSPTAVRT